MAESQMIIECTRCGRKGTLASEPYSGKKVRLKCPYCSRDFIFAIPQNGNVPVTAAAPPQMAAPVVELPPPAPPKPPEPVVTAPPPPPPAPAAPVAQPAAAPEVSDALINEAKRIARLVISEIKLYNQDKIAKAKTRKEVLDMLKNDLIKGKQHYNSRIASKLPAGPDYFMETVKEILLAGKS